MQHGAVAFGCGLFGMEVLEGDQLPQGAGTQDKSSGKNTEDDGGPKDLA